MERRWRPLVGGAWRRRRGGGGNNRGDIRGETRETKRKSKLLLNISQRCTQLEWLGPGGSGVRLRHDKAGFLFPPFPSARFKLLRKEMPNPLKQRAGANHKGHNYA